RSGMLEPGHLWGSPSIYIDNDQVSFTPGYDGSSYNASSAPIERNKFYDLSIVVPNTNTYKMYINGELVAERTGIVARSLDLAYTILGYKDRTSRLSDQKDRYHSFHGIISNLSI